MTSLRPPRPLLASLPFAAAAAVVGTIAAQTPHPSASVRAEAIARPPARSFETSAALHVVSRLATPTASVSEPPVALAESTPAATSVASTNESRITATWENAPIENVLDAFARFTSRAVIRSSRVNGTISAVISDEPWAGALRRIMAEHGFSAAIGADTIVVDVATTRKDGESSAAKIPLDTIAVWIALHHPEVVRGNGVANQAMIVVDANDRYLRSIVDTVSGGSVMSADDALDLTAIQSVEVLKGSAAIAAYGAGAEHGVISITTKDGVKTVTAPERANALYRAIEARTRPGLDPGARPLYVIDGVVYDPSKMASSDALARLAIASDQIDAVEVIKLPAGRIGPNALGVIIIKVK